MHSPKSTEPKSRKASFLDFLAWWKTDPVEIERQVTQYHTLKITQSARGTSMLLCAFCVVATSLLGGMVSGLSAGEIAFETIIWTVLGFAMHRGLAWTSVAPPAVPGQAIFSDS